MAHSFNDRLARLNALRAQAHAGGGPEKIAKIQSSLAAP